eukprot:TRINITY_DN9309_c1_g1_i1.p2 TRINITY_DN9309_c1_g1~~TRINITY_DN9309_c1_g1_i1.p2  ORF type:complete len:431 (+),score=130.79 TRINITY_DN9309_c1_g1_i1:1242-2534(+)
MMSYRDEVLGAAEGFVALSARDAPADTDAIGAVGVFAKWARHRTLAVAFTNAAYVEEGLVTNLMCSWRRMGWTAYVVVATDAAAAAGLAEVDAEGHVHWHAPYWAGTSAAKLRTTYNATAAYVAFIQKRTAFARALAARLPGEAAVDYLILTDGDTVWLRDPMAVVAAAAAAALGAAAGGPELAASAALLRRSRCDGYVVNDVVQMDAAERRVEPVGGFIIWRLGDRVDGLYRLWTEVMECLGSREQPALHAALSLTDARSAPLAAGAAARPPPGTLLLCLLPEYHFPASEVLTLRLGTSPDGGAVSEYLRRYGLRSPRDAAATVAVAHANLKYKQDNNKVAWLAQFRMYFYNAAAKACVDPPGPAPTLRPIAVPAPSPARTTPIQAGVGWARLGDGRWVHDMREYLTYRHSPGEKWGWCKAELRRRAGG